MISSQLHMSSIRLIAHRGLFEGPDVNLENRPEQIEMAIANGYDCEIDLWCVDNQLFLGHDRPDYTISRDWLSNKPLWIHAKNLAALEFLVDDITLNYFWHENDAYTLTSRGYIWAFPGRPLNKWSIMVMPEYVDPELTDLDTDCFGICSDYITKIQKTIGIT